MVVIYGKIGCKGCDTAKAYCEANSIPYTYMLLGADYQLNEFVKIGEGKWKSFPMITYNGEFVGSLESLKEILK